MPVPIGANRMHRLSASSRKIWPRQGVTEKRKRSNEQMDRLQQKHKQTTSTRDHSPSAVSATAMPSSSSSGDSRSSIRLRFDSPVRALTDSTQPSGTHKPAELFSTRFITAMKVNDSEHLNLQKCIILQDPWRHEWNNGIQVPVAGENIPQVDVRVLDDEHIPSLPTVSRSSTLNESPHLISSTSFSLPRELIKSSKSASVISRSGAFGSNWNIWYDLDRMDTEWLALYNELHPLSPIDECQMEKVMEALENACQEMVLSSMTDPKCLQYGGREFDDDSWCDICLSPDSVDGDQIVFCDGCDMAVHQSCYGIDIVPAGQWLCRPCSIAPGKKVECLLCPNTGGAMKCTRSGERWAHVSCAMWIPEVRFGDFEALEPIVNISKIPPERWQLRCSLCDKRRGACIQCSKKSCSVSYHVTCAQKFGLDMKFTINGVSVPTRNMAQIPLHRSNDSVDEATGLAPQDGLIFVSYCSKHSKYHQESPAVSGLNLHSPSFDNKNSQLISTTDAGAGGSRALRRQPPIMESPRRRRAMREQNLQSRYFLYVSHLDASGLVSGADISNHHLSALYEYWKIKRKANNCRPLMMLRTSEDRMQWKIEEESLIRKIKAMLALRRNLERARNLAYMVSKRERNKRAHLRLYGDLVDLLNKNYESGSITDSMIDSCLSPINDYEQDLIKAPLLTAKRKVANQLLAVGEPLGSKRQRCDSVPHHQSVIKRETTSKSPSFESPPHNSSLMIKSRDITSRSTNKATDKAGSKASKRKTRLA